MEPVRWASCRGVIVETAERANALADRYWDQLLEIEPILGTMVGDERFDDRLADPSPAGRAKGEAAHRAALQELAGIDRAELDESGRATLDILEAIARRFLSDIEHRTDRLGVASHPVHSLRRRHIRQGPFRQTL